MTAETNSNLNPSGQNWARQLTVLGLAAAFCIFYLIFGGMTGIYIPCLFRVITHWYCPGCGVTRMLLALLAGDFYQAFRYNPLLCILLPFVVVYLIDLLISRAKNRKSLLARTPNWIWVLVIAILVVYGIMRNLPWFEYLAPIDI